MAETLSLEANLLLGALPSASLDRLRATIRVVEMLVAERVYETGSAPDAMFPLDGIVSMVQELEDGTAVEVGMVGAEGLGGFGTVLGASSSPHTAVVQGRGLFAVCSARELREQFVADPAVRDVLLRWFDVLLASVAQTAVCNRVHEADVRLARWLLLIQDRAATDEISVTQEFLALMLSSRRATINEAMARLVSSGAIEHRRGRVRVLDRELLESKSCLCYANVFTYYESAFGFAPRAKRRVTPVD